MTPTLPDADYVVLGSRVALGLDGGFAVAVAGRVALLRSAGAADPLLLTLDGAPSEVHAAQREEFVAAGLLDDPARMRNLFDEVRARPAWLATAGEPGSRSAAVTYREVTDAAGAAVASLPVIENDPAWHLTREPVVLHAPSGDRVVAGFGGLYRAWLAAIAAERRAASGDPDRVFVVICESRQVGELLAGWREPWLRIVHTVHNSHLPAPHDDPAAPLDGLWARWLGTLDAYDAVLWPTRAQAAEVAARFGDPGTFRVVPGAIDAGGPLAAERDPRRAVSIGRLAPQKRLDAAIRAWRIVVDAVPHARLDIYGDGPLASDLQALIAELDLGGSVTLRGHTDDRDAVLDSASVFLVSTAFEGQGLAIAEALVRGVPVVSFDVRYGPREAIGEGGVLVPSGDVDALAAAVIRLLTDDDARERMSAAAAASGARFTPDAVRPVLVSALAAAVGTQRSAPGHTFPAHGS